MVLAQRAVCEVVGGRVIILNADNGQIFELNPTAAAIWNELQSDPELAVKSLVDQGYMEDDARNLLEEFISQLKTAGLVD